jgi:hypothetical protein
LIGFGATLKSAEQWAEHRRQSEEEWQSRVMVIAEGGGDFCASSGVNRF